MSKDAEIVAVFGRRGSGKSTLVKHRLRDQRRVVVFDTVREYGAEGFVQVETVRNLREALSANWQGGFRIAFVPPARGRRDAFDLVSRLILRAQRPYFEGADSREILFVVEEADTVYGLDSDSDAFTECILQGRHYGVNILFVTQRPKLVAPTLRGNARQWFVLPLDYHEDRAEVLRRTGNEWREAMRTLANHHFLHIADGETKPGRNPPIKR